MKVKDIMTKQVIGIREFETVDVAARTLERYNIGALPVYGIGGAVSGMITDRDLVTRCIAAGRQPEKTTVGQIMTNRVSYVTPEADVRAAAQLMSRRQIRRLPVMENGRICGMVSLKDLAIREESALDAADVLSDVSDNQIL